jgi:hypothetical protein
MFATFVLLLSFGVMAYTTRKLGALSPISLFAIFAAADGLFYTLLLSGIIEDPDFTAIPLPTEQVASYGYYLTLWMSALALLSALSVPKNASLNRGNLGGALLHDTFKLKSIRIRNVYFKIAVFIFFLELIHFLIIDKSLLWSNSTYLLLSDASKIGAGDGVGRLLHILIPFLGLIAATATGYWWARRDGFLTAVSVGILSYPVLFALAQNSRRAALSLTVILLARVLFDRRILRLSNWVLGLLIAVFFLKSIYGRGTPYQGIAGILPSLLYIDLGNLSDLKDIAIGTFANIIQAAPNFANAIDIAPEYPLRYKLLAMLPTISAIDGYERVRLTSQVTLTAVAPMNSFGEAYHFGVVFAIAFSTGIILWLRQTTIVLLRRPGLVSLVLVTGSLWTMLVLSQYALRTGWRWVIFFGVVAFIYERVAERTGKPVRPVTPKHGGVDW